MTNRFRFTALAFVTALALALTLPLSAAASTADLEGSAGILQQQFAALSARMDACGEGLHCDDAQAIDDMSHVLHASLVTLQAARNAAVPCSNCQSLDMTLHALHVTDANILARTCAWEESS